MHAMYRNSNPGLQIDNCCGLVTPIGLHVTSHDPSGSKIFARADAQEWGLDQPWTPVHGQAGKAGDIVKGWMPT